MFLAGSIWRRWFPRGFSLCELLIGHIHKELQLRCIHGNHITSGALAHTGLSCKWQMNMLKVYLSIYSSVCRSNCLSTYLSICRPIYVSLSVCLSIYQPVYTSTYLSTQLTNHLSIHPSVKLSIHPPISLSVCLSMSLTIQLSIFHLSFNFTIYVLLCLSSLFIRLLQSTVCPIQPFLCSLIL